MAYLSMYYLNHKLDLGARIRPTRDSYMFDSCYADIFGES